MEVDLTKQQLKPKLNPPPNLLPKLNPLLKVMPQLKHPPMPLPRHLLKLKQKLPQPKRLLE